MSRLQPPHPDHVEDPGAHELSDSEDHFSSASEGGREPENADVPSSPVIPQTRVERVDDKPAHGEVPGTIAYDKRTADAVPDEIEIIPEGQRSRASSSVNRSPRPLTPGGSPIPKTVVERVDDKPAYGEVEGTQAREKRVADAVPDEVRTAPPEARDGTLHGSAAEPVNLREQQKWPADTTVEEQLTINMHEVVHSHVRGGSTYDSTAAAADDDDFDDFAEEAGEDDDFGDFDEAGEIETEDPLPSQSRPDLSLSQTLPQLDLTGLSYDEAQGLFEPYFDAIFPREDRDVVQNEASTIPAPSAFISDRSLSLWQQLVSPPPMQPPNWTRSRIRRLFLVSLGVPVDLDEILPPSKQKRLVLPNIALTTNSNGTSSPLDRIKENATANASSTSINSKGTSRKSKAERPQSRSPLPPPEFDANAAMLLCSTTPEAMMGFEDNELKAHLMTLNTLNEKASSVLEYWLQRKDEGLKEKEALEGVIENLVGFVKGRRGK